MKKNFRHQQVAIFVITNLMLWITAGATCLGAVPEESMAKESSQTIIHGAAQAVDEAWEEFHSAAIGGTLASPAIQTRIESQLHQARSLLMEARMANRRKDWRSVIMITEKVIELSSHIVRASREKKQ